MADLGKSKHTAQHSIPPSLCSNLSEAVCCLSPTPQPPRPNTSVPPTDSLAFFGLGSPSSLVMATSMVVAATVVVVKLSGWLPVSTAVDCVEPSPSDIVARAFTRCTRLYSLLSYAFIGVYVVCVMYFVCAIKTAVTIRSKARREK